MLDDARPVAGVQGQKKKQPVLPLSAEAVVMHVVCCGYQRATVRTADYFGTNKTGIREPRC